MSAADLGHLDDDRLDRLCRRSPRVAVWRTVTWNRTCDGPRTPRLVGLDRRMKGQRAGRMADGENRGLAWLEVVA